MKRMIFQENTDMVRLSNPNLPLTQGPCYYIPIRNLHLPYINPRECGYQYCLSNHFEDWHIREDHYLLHYVISGEGFFHTENETYHLKPGQCFLLKTFQKIKYHANKNNPWYYIWIGFSGDVTEELANVKNPILNIDKKLFENFLEAANYSNTRELYLSGCIALLLSEILSSDEIDKNDEISKVKNYINTNYMFSPKVSDIANAMNINSDYLTRLFKRQTGLTISEYIVKRKMKAAQNFLESGLNVNETAQMIGYSDQAAFSRAYKKYYGYSPSEKK